MSGKLSVLCEHTVCLNRRVLGVLFLNNKRSRVPHDSLHVFRNNITTLTKTTLYGMRFGKLTRYCVLDVDKHSAFHRVSGLASAASLSQVALPRSQPGCAALVGTATSLPPVLTPAQVEQRRRQQQREGVQVARMQRWLETGDSILVREAQAWFTAQAERERSQLAVEETDPGG